MSNIGLPKFEFEWQKTGVAKLTPLKYGTLMLIILDDVQPRTYNEYSRLVDVVEGEYNATNYKYITDIFGYNITKLLVVTIPTTGSLSDVVDTVESNISDYIVYPEATVGEQAALVSLVKSSRDTTNKLKCVVPLQTTPPDSPYIVQFDIQNPIDSEGNAITQAELLAIVAAQRVGSGLTQSMTYKKIGKVFDFTAYTDPESELAKGMIIPIRKNNKIVYARDISSLTTLDDQYDERWQQNQRVAVMDTVERDIFVYWDENFIGKYQNSGDNKRAFLVNVNKYISDRAGLTTDPVQAGIFWIDWEEHRDILRAEGKTEEEIAAYTQAQLEDIDTGTWVYVLGQVQINGIMEDVRFKVSLATIVEEPVF